MNRLNKAKGKFVDRKKKSEKCLYHSSLFIKKRGAWRIRTAVDGFADR